MGNKNQSNVQNRRFKLPENGGVSKTFLEKNRKKNLFTFFSLIFNFILEKKVTIFFSKFCAC